jgi:7-carboxy-7-deazaguanine synthase
MTADIINVAERRERRFPVTEIFGPTIQGEGPDAGKPCLFVRFGGCDFECSWCDSLHAVLPEYVRNAERLTVDQIIHRLELLSTDDALLVVLSGGNPALHDLAALVDRLHAIGHRVAIETQGTKWKPWIGSCDTIVTSPKPPSSGMEFAMLDFDEFLRALPSVERAAIKVVVGDSDDYDFAKMLRVNYPTIDFYLSVLNPAGSMTDEFDVGTILESYRRLCEVVAADPYMVNVRVMPQLHTLAWGAEVGR